MMGGGFIARIYPIARIVMDRSRRILRELKARMEPRPAFTFEPAPGAVGAAPMPWHPTRIREAAALRANPVAHLGGVAAAPVVGGVPPRPAPRPVPRIRRALRPYRMLVGTIKPVVPTMTPFVPPSPLVIRRPHHQIRRAPIRPTAVFVPPPPAMFVVVRRGIVRIPPIRILHSQILKALHLPLPAPPETLAVVSTGLWSTEVHFNTGDEFRITLDGPSADDIEVRVVVRFRFLRYRRGTSLVSAADQVSTAPPAF